MHEYLSLNSYRHKAGGSEQNLAKRLIVLLVVKAWSASVGFRAIFYKSQNCQATDKTSPDKRMDTLTVSELRKHSIQVFSNTKVDFVDHNSMCIHLEKYTRCFRGFHL